MDDGSHLCLQLWKTCSCFSGEAQAAVHHILEDFFDPSRTSAGCPGSLTVLWHLRAGDANCWCAGSWSLAAFYAFMCIMIVMICVIRGFIQYVAVSGGVATIGMVVKMMTVMVVVVVVMHDGA